MRGPLVTLVLGSCRERLVTYLAAEFAAPGPRSGSGRGFAPRLRTVCASDDLLSPHRELLGRELPTEEWRDTRLLAKPKRSIEL
jgi:hypothetical protein